MEHIIWSMRDENFYSSDWQDTAIEHCEINNIDIDYHADNTADLLATISEGIYGGYLDDERITLNKTLNGDIVAIGTFGRWNGGYAGWRFVGDNISHCLYDDDCAYWTSKWYCDDNDFKYVGSHHDGTNSYTYRLVKDRVAFSNAKTNEEMYAVTESIKPYIDEIYGW